MKKPSLHLLVVFEWIDTSDFSYAVIVILQTITDISRTFPHYHKFRE